VVSPHPRGNHHLSARGNRGEDQVLLKPTELPSPRPAPTIDRSAAGPLSPPAGRAIPTAALWFTAAVALCVAFAWFTQHRWEDYYITLRTSRNLVEGHGLVFQPGERVHSFTSPLGVLLPAAAIQLAGGRDADAATIWIFRGFCIAALAAAAVGLQRIGRQLGWPPVAGFMLPALLLTDAKCVDFTINGMETAFMLLFIVATVRTLLSGGPRLPGKLGACWGALMWTRPDGFIFGGAITLAWILWMPGDGQRRERWIAAMKAVPIAAALYAPWLGWAWLYYGSPVPHTIIAKGLAAPRLSLLALPEVLLRQTVLFPVSGGLRDAFLPAYVWFGGWPAGLKTYLIGLTWVCLLYFLWPRAARLTRMFSFTFFLCSLYGTAAPAAPWYVPSHALFAFLTLAAIVAEHASRFRLVRVVAIGHLVLCATLLAAVGWQLRQQQRLVEAQRADLGRWLKQASYSPQDTVWLECLGYVGYFSELKMLDFPGLCAPEVVQARRTHGNDWGTLIRTLRPDWLVLRRNHREHFERADPALVTVDYELARTFDAAPEIARVSFLPGRAYLEQDQTFDVYRRRAPAR
jgi:hypothetical protein